MCFVVEEVARVDSHSSHEIRIGRAARVVCLISFDSEFFSVRSGLCVLFSEMTYGFVGELAAGTFCASNCSFVV